MQHKNVLVRLIEVVSTFLRYTVYNTCLLFLLNCNIICANDEE